MVPTLKLHLMSPLPYQTRHQVAWTLLVLSFWALPVAAESVRVELEGSVPAEGLAGLGLYVLEPRGGELLLAQRLAPASRDPEEDLTVEIEVSEAERLALQAPGFWSPTCEIRGGECRFQVEPGGLAAFRFSDPAGGAPELPEVLAARAGVATCKTPNPRR